MNNDKTWMYRRLENGFVTNEYCVGVEAFVTFALSHPECLLNGKLRCPCNRNKCQNKCYLDEDTVKVHLGRYGFVPKYDNWYFHGEQYVRPFYENVNMDVPTSSYRLPKVDHAPQKYPISDPIYTHRRPDGSFVDERSRLVHQSMEALRDESLTHLDDETIPIQPSSEEVNNMFKHVVGGRKKGRMYGCGSMTSTFYPHEMAPRPRGGGSRSSHYWNRTREVVEQQNRVVEFLRVDLQALQRREDELEKKNEMLEKKNEMLESRLSTVEDQIHRLVSGMPHVAPMHPHTQSYDRVLHGRCASSRGRSIAHLSRPDPHAAGSSRGDRFAVSSSRPDLREKRLPVVPSYHRTFSQDHMYSQQWVGPSQDFGVLDDDDDEDGDDRDDDGVYDDDKTQIP